MIKQFYLTYRQDPSRVDLDVMEMNRYSTIPQSSRTGTSPLDGLVSYPGHLLEGRVIPLDRHTVNIFYSPSLLG